MRAELEILRHVAGLHMKGNQCDELLSGGHVVKPGLGLFFGYHIAMCDVVGHACSLR
jgi:hypothetical protein